MIDKKSKKQNVNTNPEVDLENLVEKSEIMQKVFSQLLNDVESKMKENTNDSIKESQK